MASNDPIESEQPEPEGETKKTEARGTLHTFIVSKWGQKWLAALQVMSGYYYYEEN